MRNTLIRTCAGIAVVAMVAVPCALGQQTARNRSSGVNRQKAVHAVSKNVTVKRDIVYASYGDRKVMLDLYLPKRPIAEPIPCIMVVHGGGWRNGDKERFASQAAYLADHGYAAACIGYRLLPEVTIRECVADSKAAVRWVRANAAQYNIDPDRIGAIGGSAGAHLVAMLGTTANVAELEGDGGNRGISSRVQAVVAMAAPADLRTRAKRLKLDPKTAALLSPIVHVDKNSAPMLLIHSIADKTVPYKESINLRDACVKAGVEARVLTVYDAPHGFWNSKNWFTLTMEQAVRFFNETLVHTST